MCGQAEDLKCVPFRAVSSGTKASKPLAQSGDADSSKLLAGTEHPTLSFRMLQQILLLSD